MYGQCATVIFVYLMALCELLSHVTDLVQQLFDENRTQKKTCICILSNLHIPVSIAKTARNKLPSSIRRRATHRHKTHTHTRAQIQDRHRPPLASCSIKGLDWSSHHHEQQFKAVAGSLMGGAPQHTPILPHPSPIQTGCLLYHTHPLSTYYIILDPG